jgi:hypothetical protein
LIKILFDLLRIGEEEELLHQPVDEPEPEVEDDDHEKEKTR